MSTPFTPILWPQSAMRMFGHMLPSWSLIWAMKTWIPWLVPFISSCEITIACVACCTSKSIIKKKVSTWEKIKKIRVKAEKKTTYFSCLTNPILLSRFTRSIYYKLLSSWVINSHCFNPPHLEALKSKDHYNSHICKMTLWKNIVLIHYFHGPTQSLQSSPWQDNFQCLSATSHDVALSQRT